jgi:ATP-dependent exoDNAse (exonuclease V) alpha subunit
MSVFVKQTATTCVFTSSDSWVILSPIEQSIKRKIESVGTPLKDWNIQINYGIKTGCNELNQRLQQALNPHGATMPFGGGLIRQGDRVMQTKNNYAKEVFNGSLGEIVSVVGDMVYVKFDDDDRELLYMNEDLSELDLAYATTIHKSQGSEYDIVILTMMKSDTSMLRRNLVYTAVTRAKKVCIIVGQRDAMDYALRDWTQEKRYTMLKDRLEAGGEVNPCDKNAR